MRGRALGVVVVMLVVLTGVAGCGGGGKGGDKARSAKTPAGVRALAVAVIDDLANGKFSHACSDLITPAARKQVGNGDPSKCESRLALAAAILGKKRLEGLKPKARAVQVTVNGDTATSPSVTGSSRTSHYRYVNGRWYAADDQGR